MKQLKILIICALSITGLECFAQNQTDSTVSDAIWNLVFESDSLVEIDPGASIEKGNKAYLWSVEIGDTALMAEALHSLGLGFYYLNQLDTAEYLLNRALDIFIKNKDYWGQSYCYYSLGSVKSDKGEYALALRNYYASLRCDQLSGDTTDQGMHIIFSIAGLHLEQGDVDIAEQKFRQALNLSMELEDQYMEHICLINLSDILIDKGQLAEAKILLDKSNNLIKGVGFSKLDLIYNTHTNASYLSSIGEYNKALVLINEVYDLAKTYGDPYTITEVLIELSEINYAAGNFNPAYTYALKAYTIAKEQAGYYLQMHSLRPLASAAETLGKTSEALQYEKSYHQFYSQMAKANINEQILNYELSKSQREEDLLRAKTELNEQVIKSENRLNITLTILLVLATLLILVIMFASIRSRKRGKLLGEQNTEIAAQQLEIEKVNQELINNLEILDKQNKNKDKIFSILSHDLREPFNQLLSLLELMDEGIMDRETLEELLPKLKSTTQYAQNSVINLLHWSKNQLTEIVTEQEKFQIKALVEKLKSSLLLTIERKKQRLKLIYEGDFTLSADYHQIEIALRNLITNAIKFSPEQSTLELKVYGDGNYVIIRVKDEGIGMTEDQIDQIMTETSNNSSTMGTFNERGTGLGLHIVSDFVKANDGFLKIKSKKGEGSTFSLYFPKG
jgi:signal transduction histidine kinase